MPAPEFHEHAAGLTWVVADEAMTRASHALVDDGRVWLVDPVDSPEAMERVAALGEPAGVLQLLDRHNRDGAAIARRLGVPLSVVPAALPDTPFEVVSVLDVPKWHEIALWWPAKRALVVAEAVGTNAIYAVGDGPVGVQPILRLFGVPKLKDRDPELLLVGHGPPVTTPSAGMALRTALANSRSDVPKLLLKLPSILRK